MSMLRIFDAIRSFFLGRRPGRLNPFEEWKDQDIRAKIKELQGRLSPYCQDEPFRIVVCGSTGAGKSSFVNNILCALKGKYVQIVNVGSSASSITKKYKEYEITLKDETQNKSLIVLCDTQGVGQSKNTEEIEAVKRALEGKFASDQNMDDTKERSDGRKRRAVYVIIVIDGAAINPNAPVPPVTTLTAIQSYANTESIPVSIFLTKCDRVDKAVGRDITKLYTSHLVNVVINITSQMFQQIPKGRIFPIVNYTDQRKAEPQMILQTLYALQEIVSDVEASMSCAVG